MNDAGQASTMKVGLIVDNPKRDLKGLLLVAHQLLGLGHEVLLIPMYTQAVDTFASGIDTLVINYARMNTRRFLTACHGAGIRLVVLDTEGGVLSTDNLDSPNNWAQHLRDTGLARLLSGYCFWGRETHDAFVRLSGMAPDRLHLTGCPRYDQCADQWRRMRRPRYHGHVLVNMNFSAINPLYSDSLEAEKKSFHSVGWDEAYVDRLYTALLQVLPRVIETVGAIAARLPDRQFVVRPHPFENSDRYRRAFAAYGNIVVDGEGDVFDAMSDATSVVHLNCGTAIDAFMMGVLPISLEFLNDPVMGSHAPLPSKVSYQASGIEDVVTAIDDADAHFQTLLASGVFSRHIEGFFYRRDGEASRRVATAIHQLPDTQGDRPARVRLALTSAANPLQWLYRVACLILGTHTINRLRAGVNAARAGKELDLPRVRQILADIAGDEAASPVVAHAPGLLPFTQLASIRISARG
jgi:surface carbohydrate biosynthesis protein